MKFESATKRSWDNFPGSSISDNNKVKFLDDEYMVNFKPSQVLSLPNNIPVEDHRTVQILHYLSQKITGLMEP